MLYLDTEHTDICQSVRSVFFPYVIITVFMFNLTPQKGDLKEHYTNFTPVLQTDKTDVDDVIRVM